MNRQLHVAPHDLYDVDGESLLGDASSSAAAAAAPSRAVDSVRLVTCIVCFADPALPPVLLSCGHDYCGMCVADLERRAGKRPRQAGFKCPQCKKVAEYYTVSLHYLEEARKRSSPAELAECDEFMRTHMQWQGVDRGAPSAKRVRTSNVNRDVSDATMRRIFRHIPKSLTGWTHTGSHFRFTMDDALVLDGVTEAERKPTQASVRARVARPLAAACVTCTRNGNALTLGLAIENVAKFGTIAWPDDVVGLA